MNIRRYLNEDFSAKFFKNIKPSFAENFFIVTEKFKHEIFLIFFEDGNRSEFSFDRFREDVLILTQYFLELPENPEVIVTVSKNSYAHCVYIVATLLSCKTLCLLNPNENDQYFGEVCRKLNRRFIFFHAQGCSPPFAEARPMQLRAGRAAKRDTIEQLKPTRGDFIYVMTSGSTGQSKIVRQSEESVLVNVDSLISHHCLNKKAVLATPLPIFHVNALEFSFFCSLMTGNKLIFFDASELINFSDFIESEQINIVSLIPNILRQIRISKKKRVSEFSQCLRYFVSAASALTTQLVSEIDQEFGVKVIQGYGLSEAVNFSCTMPIDADDMTYKKVSIDTQYPSIGVALRGNEVLIVDNHARELEENTTGEIALRGFNLMTGYLGENSLDQNTESFFRTGDLGFFKEFDGQRFFFINGRAKDIAKRNGETIALRDIDDVILALNIPDFDCIAVGFKNSARGEEIGLVVRSNIDPSTNSDFVNLLASLPSHRSPRVICFGSKLVLRTASGKPKRWTLAHLFQEYENVNLSRERVFKQI